MKGDATEWPVDCEIKDVVLQVIRELKTGKAPRPSCVSLELIAASCEEGVQDGLGLPAECHRLSRER